MNKFVVRILKGGQPEGYIGKPEVQGLNKQVTPKTIQMTTPLVEDPEQAQTYVSQAVATFKAKEWLDAAQVDDGWSHEVIALPE